MPPRKLHTVDTSSESDLRSEHRVHLYLAFYFLFDARFTTAQTQLVQRTKDDHLSGGESTNASYVELCFVLPTLLVMIGTYHALSQNSRISVQPGESPIRSSDFVFKIK